MGLNDISLRFKEVAQTQVPGNERDVYVEFFTFEKGELPKTVVFQMVEETNGGKSERYRTLVGIRVEDLERVLAAAKTPSPATPEEAWRVRRELEAKFPLEQVKKYGPGTRPSGGRR